MEFVVILVSGFNVKIKNILNKKIYINFLWNICLWLYFMLLWNLLMDFFWLKFIKVEKSGKFLDFL